MLAEKISTKIMAIFLLLLFVNSVFAYNLDFDRINAEQTDKGVTLNFQGTNQVQDFGYGCYTEELPPGAVENLWRNLLIKGFNVDLVSSDQPANTERDKLKQNKALLTNSASQAGDLVVKKEMPSQLMNPLETPSILGQACYGPFSYGINLTETLRVGRCTGDDNFACYLESDGLFRQNGNHGFWDELGSIKNDVVDMIGVNKLKEEAGELIDPEKDYSTNEDLGIFSDMSYEELAYFKQTQFDDANRTEIDIKKTKVLFDKAIQNSIKTDTFNASMETTCSGENCYINVYSLFDKMFNQYFSADLVFTSISPVLWKFSSKIFGPIGKTALKTVGIDDAAKILKSKKIIKEGHFWDNLLKGNNPMKAVGRSMDLQVAQKNIGNYTRKMSGEWKNKILKKVDRYDMKPQFEKYAKALQSKKNIQGITDEFFKTGEFAKLNKAQKRVFVQIAQEYQENFKVSRIIHDQLTTQNKEIMDRVVTLNGVATTPREVLSNPNMTRVDFYKTITKDELDTLTKNAGNMNSINKSWDDYTNNMMPWDDKLADLKSITERKFKITENRETTEYLINKVKKLDSRDEAKITDLPSKGKAFIPDGTGTKFDNLVKTQDVTATFADGSTGTITKMVPYKEGVDLSTGQHFFRENLDSFRQKPDVYIEYVQKNTGAMKKVRGPDLIVDDIDAASTFKWYPLKSTPMTNPDDVLKYGYDPFELAHDYTESIGFGKLKDADIINDNIVRVTTNQGWVTGRGLNYINQKMKSQQITKWNKKPLDMVSHSAKAYWYNWLYWEFKTAGASIPFIGEAFEKYSMYRLPDTYTAVNISLSNTGDVYNDAYMDFFANDGSDQGDLFMKYFNSMLFWMVNLSKELLEETPWKATQTFSDWVKDFTEGHIRRSSTDDIALFTDAENTGCTTACYIKIGDSRVLEKQTLEKSLTTDTNQDNIPEFQKEIKTMSISYGIPNGLTIPSYVLENTSEDNMEEEGQTIISFSHHTDYDGTMGGKSTKDSVNLVQARKDEELCSQRIRDLELAGIPIGWTSSWTGKSYRAGMVSAAFSNLSYLVFTAPQHRIILGAIIGDVIPQVLIVPQIHNCVDDEEGYYSHIFVSKEEYERIEKDPINKVGEVIQQGAEGVQQALTGVTQGTQLQETIKNTTEQVKSFAEKKLIDNPIVQSRFEVKGNSSASINGKLFFLELGKNTTCRASAYNDKGVEFLTDQASKDTLIIDKANGEMSIQDEDGTIKQIIGPENKDWVRLIATNLGIPAKVVPHSISYLPVPETDAPLFSMDIYGNLTVENYDFLSCLKNNYTAQTGLMLQGNNLTDYLGSVRVVTTTNPLNPEHQYDIIPKGRQGSNQIVAEGVPRKSANGESARTVISGKRNTSLYPINGREETLGKNIAIQFERGQLIYNGERNSYIMWVEQTYVMHQSQIDGLKTKLNTYTDEETGCEEIALDFKVSAVEDNDEAKANADEMNKALSHVGPFQMFDTATKTFIFYTSEPPECEQRMKIIDKKTGKIITDQAIKDILETPDGMIITTEDGREHKFEFSAEDGVPRIKYNDELETLLSAQGKNGAFWYDPNTGNWYTENGHLIPFDPQFKEGMMFKTGEDGKAVGIPAQNPMNINIGSGYGTGKSGFSIPLTPEKILPMTMYILIILGAMLMVYQKRDVISRKRKK